MQEDEDMSLPRQLSLMLTNRKILNFVTKDVKSSKKLAGLSEKAIYFNEDDPFETPYYVKRPKKRPLETILTESVAPSIYEARRKWAHLNNENPTHSPKLFKLKNKVKKQIEHVEKQCAKHQQSLRDSQFFLEALSPRIAAAIFGDFLAVPENYFYRTSEGQNPLLLSKGIKEFREFLSEEMVVKNKVIVKDWENESLPLRDQLHLTPKYAEALGKLFFIALLMGHLDLLNNINLTNSGVIDAGGELIPAIVDWGNTLGTGFGGLSAEESAAKNPDLLYGKINFNDTDISGFQHCVPFDKVVYPLLPRQLVRDLFNLTDDNVLSKAMLRGFEEACLVAQKKLPEMDNLIPMTIETVLTGYTAAADSHYLREILNHEIYFPTPKLKKDGYTLTNILKGRIESLAAILVQLKQGISIEEIGQNRLSEIIKAQNYRPLAPLHIEHLKPRFFPFQKNTVTSDDKASHDVSLRKRMNSG